MVEGITCKVDNGIQEETETSSGVWGNQTQLYGHGVASLASYLYAQRSADG